MTKKLVSRSRSPPSFRSKVWANISDAIGMPFPQREDGYLRADADRAAALRGRLAVNGEHVIGLSWQSHNPYAGRTQDRAAQDFIPLLSLPDCRFIDLQYGDTAEERREIEDKLGVKVERLEDIDNTKDIDGLAALITACDLVASVSNTNAHLAGALGTPAWVFVPFGHSKFWYWTKGKPRQPLVSAVCASDIRQSINPGLM